MHRGLVRTILYPVHEVLRGRPTCRLLRRFRGTEHLTPGEIDDLRDSALRDLVRHAAREVPFWKRHFESSGFDPEAFRGAVDLGRLPTMDKPLIREHLEDLTATSMRGRLIPLATGGSSGEPLMFYSDKVREASQLAAKFRCREWFDIRVGDRQVDLWGAPIEIEAQDRVRTSKDLLLNFKLLSAFELSDRMMIGFRDELIGFKTDFIYGYASVMARYAAFLSSRGEDLHGLGLKGAVSTAELLFPDQRALIESVYGCPVINEYGCRDGGYIAQECPKGRLHIAADTVHVEILDENLEALPVGEVGEIAVTNLFSRGMPMIRYRLGDRARLDPDPCPCGRHLPLLGSLEGRVTDTLETPEGNRVHGLALMYVVRTLPGVARYQVIQDAIDHVDVLVIPTPEADREELMREIQRGTRKTLGETMRIDVKMVDDIPPAASGKMRAIWNKLDRA